MRRKFSGPLSDSFSDSVSFSFPRSAGAALGTFSVASQAGCRRASREAQREEEPDRKSLSCSNAGQDKGVGPGVNVSRQHHY
jgi:hypothetical protein